MIPHACQQKPTEALAAPKGDPRDKPNKEGSQRLVSSSSSHPLVRGQGKRGRDTAKLRGNPQALTTKCRPKGLGMARVTPSGMVTTSKMEWAIRSQVLNDAGAQRPCRRTDAVHRLNGGGSGLTAGLKI